MVKLAETGGHTYDGPVYSLSPCALELRSRLLLGKHNGHVLQKLLWLSEYDVNRAYVKG